MLRSIRFAVLAVLVFAPALALGQSRGPDAARRAWVDQLAALRGDAVKARWDFETGAVASLRFAGDGRPLFGATPEDAVARWLEQEVAPLLDEGLRAGDPELLPAGPGLAVAERRDLGGGHLLVELRQVVSGVPVVDAALRVELVAAPGGGWVPLRLSGRYYPGLPADLDVTVGAVAYDTAAELFPQVRVDDEITLVATASPVVLPRADGAFAAALAVTGSTAGHDAVRVYLDARDGSELGRVEVACFATAEGLAYERNPGDTARANQRLADLYVDQGNTRVTTDAQGQHNLTGMVTLDGLRGPLARIFVHQEEELSYSGPADIRLAPAEGQNDQDEIAAFFHVQHFNAHLRNTYAGWTQALDTRFPIVVRYKQNGQPLQNAFFSPQPAQAGGETFPAGYIGMGTFGGREAARSASVIRHEYVHALLSRIVSLNGSRQAGGLNEGLADYLPAAHMEESEVGRWLRNPYIRDIDRDYVWPQDDNGDVHRVGNIFAGALWDARKAAEARETDGRLAVDQAVAAGVLRLRDRPDLLDAREAIVQADRALTGGRYRTILERAFFEHGIGPDTANDAPDLDPVGDQVATAGQPLTLSLQAADPDGDPLTFAVSSLANASIDPATGDFTFSPDASQVGVHQVTFTVTDGDLDDAETIQIDVQPGAQAPLFPGTTGPVTSTATPGATGAAAPGRGGGGGGGGCSLRAGAPTSSAPWLAALLLLGLVALRRRADDA